MLVSGVQKNLSVNSPKTTSSVGLNRPINSASDLSKDNFSKKKLDKVPFKGSWGALGGAVLGGVLGAMAIASGGVLAPFAGAIFAAATAGGAVAGEVVGSKDDKK